LDLALWDADFEEEPVVGVLVYRDIQVVKAGNTALDAVAPCPDFIVIVAVLEEQGKEEGVVVMAVDTGWLEDLPSRIVQHLVV
jgi:hypothetical protein